MEESLSAGWFPIITVGAPATQGEAVTGTHGIGVRTPLAAAVADATVGFDGDEQVAKVGMFIMGLWSIMFAAGMFPAFTKFRGSTISEAGADPKEHDSNAPETT